MTQVSWKNRQGSNMPENISRTHKTSVSQGDIGRDRNTAKLSKYIILGASAYFETEGVFRQITEILFQNNWNIGIGWSVAREDSQVKDFRRTIFTTARFDSSVDLFHLWWISFPQRGRLKRNHGVETGQELAPIFVQFFGRSPDISSLPLVTMRR